MNQITERILIGAKDDQPFSRYTAVLNLAPDLHVLTHEKLEYAQIGLIDGPGNRLGTIVGAVMFLHQLLDRHEAVVLICHGGTGRSGLVTALYMAVRHDVKFPQALEIVRTNRPAAVPSEGLLRNADAAIPLLQNLFKS